MSDTALTYRLALSMLRSASVPLVQGILAAVGTEENFFTMKASALAAFNSRHSRFFDDEYRRSLLEKARAEEAFINANSITALYYTDPGYPQRFLECDDAPPMLYSLGECDLNAECAISIVGTRHATPYGLKWVTALIEEIAERMTTKPLIISGLAHGIDVCAHKAALAAGLPTVGVLAHGLNTIYPAQHRDIAARMVRNGGALITEYHSGTSIHRGNFLQRNRIIAAMADVTIVAESAAKGGAMATARIAREYNREVCALPGRVADLYSQGCNRLISRNVASLITDLDDLAAAMRWPLRSAEGTPLELPLDLSDTDAAIIDYLRVNSDGRLGPMSAQLNMPVHKLTAALVDLEFRGLVTAFPGGVYRNA